MFRFPFVLIFLLFSLVSVKSVALEVNDLYQVTVVVDSQTREQREEAITKALQGVFLKVGGKQSVLQHKVLRQAKKSASRYVSQYRYQRKNDELSLVVSFNEDKVNQLFKQADLSLWGSLRPQVLLWLIDEQGPSRHIVAADADTIIPESINNFSSQRGLPILLPLMDLTDSEQVILSDFWAYFPEQIQQASLRYFADTVIVMRISDSSLLNDDVQAAPDSANELSCGLLCQPEDINTPKVLDWRVYTQGALYTQRYQGVDKVDLITQGLSDITELIYQSYALSTTAENDFVIEVKNVTSLKNDTQLFDFLTKISAVKAVTLISAQGNVRRFKLDLIGSQASFLASLKLNNKLTQQLEPQLENFVGSLDFMPEGDSIDGSYHANNRKMKVIVLGNTDSDTQNPNLQDTNSQNNALESIDSINTDLDKNKHMIVEQVKPPIEAIIPLTIVPNVPIFYWEQG